LPTKRKKNDFDSLEHKGSISKNQNFSGNDFKDFASFNSCFYHVDNSIIKMIFTSLESSSSCLSTGICIILKILQNLAILAKNMHIEPL